MDTSYMLFRVKTGCKQYNFDSLYAIQEWLKRPCYKNEIVRIDLYDEDNIRTSTLIGKTQTLNNI